MGYYIETGSKFNKADWIKQQSLQVKSAALGTHPPVGMVPVVVVVNRYFEAAGIAFDKQELQVFSEPDGLPKEQLFVPREVVVKLQPIVEKALAWP